MEATLIQYVSYQSYNQIQIEETILLHQLISKNRKFINM